MDLLIAHAGDVPRSGHQIVLGLMEPGNQGNADDHLGASPGHPAGVLQDQLVRYARHLAVKCVNHVLDVVEHKIGEFQDSLKGLSGCVSCGFDGRVDVRGVARSKKALRELGLGQRLATGQSHTASRLPEVALILDDCAQDIASAATSSPVAPGTPVGHRRAHSPQSSQSDPSIL